MRPSLLVLPDARRGSRAAVARQLAPFAVIAAVAFALVPVSGDIDVRWTEVGLAFALSVAIVAAGIAFPALADQRHAGWTAVVAVGIVALLRDGTGGARGGYGLVMLVPVLWVALHGTRRQLWAVLAAVVAALAVPFLAVGAPGYPQPGWRTLPMLLLLCGFIGVLVQELLARERAVQAGLQDAQAELQRLAATDPLTGLANRRALEAQQRREIATAARTGRPLALALLDLDNFKAYNDAHGHPAGDALLRAVSVAWAERLRDGDVLGRWGGEEFCLLLPGCEAGEAGALVERLRHLAPDRQTFSAGVTTWRPGMAADDLVAAADAALYEAKRRGRDRTVVADEAIVAAAARG